MKISLLIPVLFFLVMISQGQRYFIFQNRSNECHSGIYINAWSSGKEYTIAGDSMQSHEMRIPIPDTVPPGLLKIIISGNCPLASCEVIYVGNDIRLTLGSNSDGSLFLEGDPETMFYWRMKNEVDSSFARLSDLKNLISAFPDDPEFTALLMERYENTLKHIRTLFRYIEEKREFPSAAILLASQNYPVPDISLPLSRQTEYVREHYFSVFDIRNELIRRSPFFASKILDFLDLVSKMKGQEDPGQAMTEGIDLLFSRTGAEDTVMGEIATVMRPWLLQNGFEDAAEYLDVKYLAARCSSENDFNLQERLGVYKNIRTGQPAPEIFWVSGRNEIMSLKSIPGKLMIVFWASWCRHCMEMLPSVYELSQKENIQVLAISLDHLDRDWESAIPAFPRWIHLRAGGGWNDEWVRMYGISGTPTIFILDENKIIAGKTAMYSDLKKILLRKQESY